MSSTANSYNQRCRSAQCFIYTLPSPNLHDLLGLLPRANALQACTGILLPEILIKIFTYACENVLTRFRIAEVIWSSPSFWTNIALHCNRAHAQNLLRLHLQNARSAPLFVEFYSVSSSEASAATMLDILSMHGLEHVRRLFIEVSSRVWKHLHSLDWSRQELEYLTLMFDKHAYYETIPPGTSLFSHFTQLQRLNLLERFPITDPQLRIHNITKLHGYHPSFVEGYRLLSLCPNVVSFRWSGRDPDQSQESLNPTSNPRITLPCLETLVWGGPTTSNNTDLIRYLRFPSVQDVTWLARLPQTTRDWMPFPVSIMSQLRSLECFHTNITLRMLRFLPSLEKLQVMGLDQEATGTRGTDSVSGTYDGSGGASPLFYAMIRMLESRRRGTNAVLEKFSFAVTGSTVTDVWRQGHQDLFSRLVRDGLYIKITQYTGRQGMGDVPV
ncbi:hypothetical protein P691DRAFT_788538 [Macrolepiota fuliginosa MF-IS2]|uniref:Uncharacterized protein n=1 Tax=Macrolepiota fuliginosa MF-IS2 TaxID=1400762 RepID=A0A9P5X2W7_9AGAR|nr:hypothetical protein P691DRAFT_788538 [Macrolepiota fuliginosa MF-IS2]